LRDLNRKYRLINSKSIEHFEFRILSKISQVQEDNLFEKDKWWAFSRSIQSER